MNHHDHNNPDDRRDERDKYVQSNGVVYAFEHRRGPGDRSRCRPAWRPCGLGVRYGLRRSGAAFDPFRWTRPYRRNMTCLTACPGMYDDLPPTADYY